jgi:hypothetical protein
VGYEEERVLKSSVTLLTLAAGEMNISRRVFQDRSEKEFLRIGAKIARSAMYPPSLRASLGVGKKALSGVVLI